MIPLSSSRQRDVDGPSRQALHTAFSKAYKSLGQILARMTALADEVRTHTPVGLPWLKPPRPKNLEQLTFVSFWYRSAALEGWDTCCWAEVQPLANELAAVHEHPVCLGHKVYRFEDNLQPSMAQAILELHSHLAQALVTADAGNAMNLLMQALPADLPFDAQRFASLFALAVPGCAVTPPPPDEDDRPWLEALARVNQRGRLTQALAAWVANLEPLCQTLRGLLAGADLAQAKQVLHEEMRAAAYKRLFRSPAPLRTGSSGCIALPGGVAHPAPRSHASTPAIRPLAGDSLDLPALSASQSSMSALSSDGELAQLMQSWADLSPEAREEIRRITLAQMSRSIRPLSSGARVSPAAASDPARTVEMPVFSLPRPR